MASIAPKLGVPGAAAAHELPETKEGQPRLRAAPFVIAVYEGWRLWEVVTERCVELAFCGHGLRCGGAAPLGAVE